MGSNSLKLPSLIFTNFEHQNKMPHSLKHYAPTYNRDPTHRLGFGQHHNTLAYGAPIVAPAYEAVGHVDYMAPAHVDYVAPAHVDYVAPAHVDYVAPAHVDTFLVQPNIAPAHVDVVAAPMYMAPVALAPVSTGHHSLKHYAPTFRRDPMHKLGLGKHHANLNPALAGMYY